MKLSATIFLLMALWLYSAAIFAQQPAYQGYDLVSYQQQKSAVKGSSANQLSLNNRTYWFSSTQNLSYFKSNPEQYLPHFGERCAYDQSQNKQSPADPQHFIVLDGRLYLFKDQASKKSWLRNAKESIQLGEKFAN